MRLSDQKYPYQLGEVHLASVAALALLGHAKEHLGDVGGVHALLVAGRASALGSGAPSLPDAQRLVRLAIGHHVGRNLY